MTQRVCTSCSSPLEAEARFCQRCGQAAEAAIAEATRPLMLSAVAAEAPVPAQAPLSPVATVAAPPPAPITVNVTAAAPQNTVVVLDGNNGPGFGMRAIWFIFVGWWLTFFWIGFAWVLNATIIGLPLGLAMINRVPKILTLRPDRQTTSVITTGNTTVVTRSAVPQLSMLVRSVYFVLVGWWASLAWSYMAWGLCVLVVTLPLGLIMFNFLPQVTTLRRN